MELVRRCFQPPRGSFFLFGPRGTGKSTWLRQTYPDAVYLDLLDPEMSRSYLARPERLHELIAASQPNSRIIIDEIQKAPALLDVAHQILEDTHRQRPQFILTGSSARKLRRGGIDLLAGRALLKTLHPFMACELGPRFDLLQSMQLGMLPLVMASPEPHETLKSYIGLYMREEVQSEGLVRNVGNFSRFLEAISLSHGSVLNISEVARECQVGRKTAEGFVQILEDLLLGFLVPVFTRRARRQLVQHPKFYYMDAGVFHSIRPKGPLDSPHETGGLSLEGLVAQHLRAWIAYSKADLQLSYWRTRSGNEVDFIVYGSDTFAAIEVKSSKSVFSQDLRSLRAFLEDYPQARAFFLYRGQERLKMGSILCLPCDEFLRQLIPDEPLCEIAVSH